MLSYRHAFHAGNFADVHKHAAWLHGIQALQKKPSPFCLLDAYAGAGSYDLADPGASKTGEWESGIGRLYAAVDLPPLLAAYVDAIRAFNGGHELHLYPGSPVIAARELRAADRLICLELHPADHTLLQSRLHTDKRVHVHRRDAREGLPALLPPVEKRGLVLVDPPYEQADEYTSVPRALLKAWSRWRTGSFLLWYPILARNAHIPLLDALVGEPVGKRLVHEVLLVPDAPGLRGSGLLWINPPWQAEDALAAAGNWLVENLGEAGAESRVDFRED